jgi:NAD(P)-dependent dehydrogenase (short-subunit alcohol dehydrogenase family)
LGGARHHGQLHRAGPFLTDANRRWIGEWPEFQAEVAASIPMGRLGHPREIAALAVYLAGEASSFMTGSTLVLDGGKLLWRWVRTRAR